jgi:hypothetical protein
MATSYFGLIEEGAAVRRRGHDPGPARGSSRTAVRHHPTEHFFDNR